MAGNELKVAEFIFRNLGKIELPHLGTLSSIGAPMTEPLEFYDLKSASDLRLITEADSKKKADFYLNEIGVSVKQKGPSFAFNRLQRANIIKVFSLIGIDDAEYKLQQLDLEVRRFHEGLLQRRSRPWNNFFDERSFKILLDFLMMKGSPNLGLSPHPAKLILEAPAEWIDVDNISIYTFDEYFEHYKASLRIAIRRQWIGQNSHHEHRRASGLVKKEGNAPWVYDEVAGTPRSGWMPGFPENDKKTVYFLMIEKGS